jgi:hypothetical protein
MRLHGVLLTLLSTGTALPYLYKNEPVNFELNTKLRDFSPQVNYTDRATVAYRRS